MFVAQRDNRNLSPVGATYHPGFLRYVAPPELTVCGIPRPTTMSCLRHCFKRDRNRAVCRAPIFKYEARRLAFLLWCWVFSLLGVLTGCARVEAPPSGDTAPLSASALVFTEVTESAEGGASSRAHTARR